MIGLGYKILFHQKDCPWNYICIISLCYCSWWITHTSLWDKEYIQEQTLAIKIFIRIYTYIFIWNIIYKQDNNFKHSTNIKHIQYTLYINFLLNHIITQMKVFILTCHPSPGCFKGYFWVTFRKIFRTYTRDVCRNQIWLWENPSSSYP